MFGIKRHGPVGGKKMSDMRGRAATSRHDMQKHATRNLRTEQLFALQLILPLVVAVRGKVGAEGD